MSDVAITVQSLGKQYLIGSKRASMTMGETLALRAHTALAIFRQREQESAEHIWALKNVSFDVKQGQIVGVIGGNGAGKSTLLKILSRITEPTTGRVRMRGRVRALLEVGTGFHGELTGRENIYLSGAVLGMKRAEIESKFEEIVEFAGTSQFLDTPVKRYSSGMYTRLAFSIAAHLEPEILIVDEVLAVGDAAFQRKCLGKMKSVAATGRTVLFVSHDMGMVQALCTRALLFQRGALVADGQTSLIVSQYLSNLGALSAQVVAERTDRRGQGEIRLTRVEAKRVGADDAPLEAGQPAQFLFGSERGRPGLSCSFTIYDQLGRPVTYFDSAIRSKEDILESESGTTFVCELVELPLLPGRYRINAALTCNGVLQDHLEAALVVEVHPGMLRGRPLPPAAGYGAIGVPHRWILPDR